MDPWADSPAKWSPQEEKQKTSSPRSPSEEKAGSSYQLGQVDPWAEPSSSASIIPTYRPGGPTADKSHNHSGSNSGGDFDPWGGNVAPIAPLSSAYTLGKREVDSTSAATAVEEEGSGWQRSTVAARRSTDILDHVQSSAAAVEVGALEFKDKASLEDDEDPWGSGAAARKAKAEQEAAAAAQRLEIMRLQDEARGRADEESTSPVEKVDSELSASEVLQEGDHPAAAATSTLPGWRSIFSKVPLRSAPPKEEAQDTTTHVAAGMARSQSEPKNDPQPSATTPAPRLWQAPSILGNHARSSSTTSRSSSTKDSPAISATKGPGWEVTTKKKQQQGGAGGLIQSLFGSVATEEDEKADASKESKEKKGSALSRIGKSLKPPPIVSAADEDDDSFATEETGIEWDSGASFDRPEKIKDLLSSDTESRETSQSTVGKLLGRWGGRSGREAQKAADAPNLDLSWLEGVGCGGFETPNRDDTKANADNDDLLSFIDQQSGPGSSTFNAAQPSMLGKGSGEKPRPSSTASAASSSKIPSLAPPPPSNKSAQGHVAASRLPFGGKAITGNSANSTLRIASASSAQTEDSQLALGDLQDRPNDSPNLGDAYRDDPTDNNSALLKERPGNGRKNNSFLRGFKTKSSRFRYDYDEDDEESKAGEDNWSAFKDDPIGPLRNFAAYQDTQGHRPDSALSVRSDRPLSSQSTTNSIPPAKPKILGSLTPKSLPASPETLGIALPPPPPGSTRATATHRQSCQPSQTTQQQPMNTPTKLSQGTTLTKDDLSFFENL